MEEEKKDITENLNATKVMPMLQRIENDLISQSSTILPQVQVQGPPQVHGPLPQDDQLQGPIVPQVFSSWTMSS